MKGMVIRVLAGDSYCDDNKMIFSVHLWLLIQIVTKVRLGVKIDLSVH